MVWHVGICLPKGAAKAYNTETKEILEIKTSDAFSTADLFLENIKKHINGSFGCVCLCLDTGYKNEERKQMIQSCKNFGFEKAELITPTKADLLTAISQSNYEPDSGDFVYVHNNEKNLYELWEITESKFCYVESCSKTPYSLKVFSERKAGEKFSNSIILYEQYSRFDIRKYPTYRCIPFNWHSYERGALVHARIIAGDTSVIKFDSNDVVYNDITVIFEGKDIFSIEKSLTLPLNISRTLEAENIADYVQISVNGEIVNFPLFEKVLLTLLIDTNNVYELKYVEVSANSLLDIDNYIKALYYEAGEKQKKSELFEESMEFDGMYPIPSDSRVAIGIKLGNSQCYAAKNVKGFTEIVIFDDISSIGLPSYVAYDEEIIKYGQLVVDRLSFHAESTVFDILKIIGQNYSDIQMNKMWSFQIIKREKRKECFPAANNYMDVEIEFKSFNGKKVKSPEEVLADLLKHINEAVVKDINEQAKRYFPKFVITLPLHFNKRQKKAVYEAASLAGLKTIYLIPEPIAAAVYHREHSFKTESEKRDDRSEGYSLFFEIGSTTFSICLLHISGKKIRIMAANENLNWKQHNFDTVLINYFTNELKINYGIADFNTKKKLKLMTECQKIIKRLSFSNEAFLDVENYDTTKEGSVFITLEHFENISSELLNEIRASIISTVDSTGCITLANIKEILLVGNGCKMPMIKKLLRDIFLDSDKCVFFHEISNESVAHGASKCATYFDKAFPPPDKIINIPKHCFAHSDSFNVVGIDLGTTRCCVAVNRKNGIETVALDNMGERSLPSYVSYDEKKEKCGQTVVKRLNYFGKSTAFDSKKIIGKSFKDILIDDSWTFGILDINEKAKILVKAYDGKNQKYPEEISAALLKYIKQKVEEFQGAEISNVVITVPATFSDAQKNATYVAALLAGWKTIHLLIEPVAAALAYSFVQPIFNKLVTNFLCEHVLVFDLGGGTLDINIFEVQYTIKYNKFKFVTQGGDSYLGGRDFDNLLIKYFCKILHSEYGIAIDEYKKHKLMLECQEIKHHLSKHNEVSLDVYDYDITKEGFISINREHFECLAKGLLEKIKNISLSTCKDGINVKKVLPFGGGCRMPMIKNLLHEIFPKAEICYSQNPDEVVAIGAAYYANS